MCSGYYCCICGPGPRRSHTAREQVPIVTSPPALEHCGILLPLVMLVPHWLLHAWWWSAIEFKTNALSLLSFVVALLIVGEEVGWRGFFLPYLLQRYSPLTSSLIVGVVWALWHLINFLLPSYPHYELPFSAFFVTTLAFSILFTWLYLNTAGSLLIATIFHAALNLFSLSGVALSRDIWLKAVVYSVAAIIVGVMRGGKIRSITSAPAN